MSENARRVSLQVVFLPGLAQILGKLLLCPRIRMP
jgi:hypothetical protein